MTKQKYLTWTISFTLLVLTIRSLSLIEVLAAPQAQSTSPSAFEVIEAVNALRIENGLLPLNTHPVLMEVAQWEANAIAGGAPGHTRPNGLTLGQWLISLGYPLAGDLSLDGYRSENWVIADTVEQAMGFWLGDAAHTNTMLSPNRSDIGAAVVNQVYVLETALQTSSGEMSSDAYALQTAIAEGGFSSSSDSSIPQYIIPVRRSTARPDGDVVHTVQYGQSLWSIAVTYNTTINQIRAWNNLGETTDIYDGQIMLVQKGATQPPPPTSTFRATVTIPATPTDPVQFPTATIQPTSTGTIGTETGEKRLPSPGVWVGVIIVIALAAGVFGIWISKRPPIE